MTYAVNIACTCGTSLRVLPPAMLEAARDEDAALALLERAAALKDDKGRRFTIADQQGVFRCPVCSERWAIPELPSG